MDPDYNITVAIKEAEQDLAENNSALFIQRLSMFNETDLRSIAPMIYQKFLSEKEKNGDQSVNSKRTHPSIALVLAPVTTPGRYKKIKHDRFKGGPLEFLKAAQGLNGYDILDITDYTGTDILDKASYNKFEEFFMDLYSKAIIPITIGGDHGISIPATTALARMYKEEERGPISTIRIDRDIDGTDGKKSTQYNEENIYSSLDERGLDHILINHPETKILHVGSPTNPNYEYNFARLKNTPEEDFGRMMGELEKDFDITFITKEQEKENLRKYTKEVTESFSDRPAYLSIDVDFHKLVNAKEFGYTPLNAWMTLKHLGQTLTGLKHLDIRGVDICEITDIPAHNAAKYAAKTFNYLEKHLL